jgi:hypothetical protein
LLRGKERKVEEVASCSFVHAFHQLVFPEGLCPGTRENIRDAAMRKSPVHILPSGCCWPRGGYIKVTK